MLVVSVPESVSVSYQGWRCEMPSSRTSQSPGYRCPLIPPLQSAVSNDLLELSWESHVQLGHSIETLRYRALQDFYWAGVRDYMHFPPDLVRMAAKVVRRVLDIAGGSFNALHYRSTDWYTIR